MVEKRACSMGPFRTGSVQLDDASSVPSYPYNALYSHWQPTMAILSPLQGWQLPSCHFHKSALNLSDTLCRRLPRIQSRFLCQCI